MDEIWGIFAANPWLWPLFAAGLAVWVAAVIVIFRSTKFLRKWLWFLLTFLSFGIGWQASADVTVSVGFPIGSLYVLGFWLFGPRPTAEEIARDTARREERRRQSAVAMAASGAGRRVVLLRTGYGLAALGAVALAALAGSGALLDAMFAGAPSTFRQQLPPGFGIGMAAGLAVVAGLFVFLAFKPYWWGKLAAAWAALSWIGFGAGSFFMLNNPAVSGTVLAAGLAVLLAALIHQIVDPRFSGPYLRRA